MPTSAKDCPALRTLSIHCHTFGASNPLGLLTSLMEAQRTELAPFEFSHHPAVRVVVGHVSYLLGQSLGPTEGTVADWRDWMNESPDAPTLSSAAMSDRLNA